MSEIFITKSKTYRVLRQDIEKAIKRKYKLERGAIGAFRWRLRGTDKFGEWRVEVYWRETGRPTKHKTLGILTTILSDIGKGWKSRELL